MCHPVLDQARSDHSDHITGSGQIAHVHPPVEDVCEGQVGQHAVRGHEIDVVSLHILQEESVSVYTCVHACVYVGGERRMCMHHESDVVCLRMHKECVCVCVCVCVFDCVCVIG